MRTVSSLTDRKSTRLNSSHLGISYAVFCLKKKNEYGLVSNIMAKNRTWFHFSTLQQADRGRLVLIFVSGLTSPTAVLSSFFFFFFNDTATTEIYTLSLHDALPICELLQDAARRPAIVYVPT